MHISDLLAERSILTKRLSILKGLVLILILAVVFVYYNQDSKIGSDSAIKKDNYVALIRIEDEILDHHKFDKMLNEVAEDKAIIGIVLKINSPGGSTGASEKIYHKLLSMKKEKTIAVAMQDAAASGAYLISLAADRIFALNMTITGSIGVLMFSPEMLDLAEKLGIKMQIYKSSPLKASPNPMEKSSPEATEAVMSVIKDSYNYFVEQVARNRKIPKNEAIKLADGRVYTGRQALSLKLIDEIGTADDAYHWILKEKGLDSSIKMKEVSPKRKMDFMEAFFERLDESSASILNKVFSKFAMQLK